MIVATAARACALVAPADGAVDAFSDALARHVGGITAFERARTELCLGERLHRANRRLEARSHLNHAWDLFDHLGAKAWAATALVELRATGGTNQRADRPSAARLLSQREMDVAQRVASGGTNREVAQDLFVNEKTVEFHLGNVYRKLGLRSRSELVRWFSEAARNET
jgi:DNA-binding CsgD family transcriptional regulator